MKKIVYKSIFSIVIVLVAFLMLPNKQVKAQEEQTFPEVIMKVPYYTASWDNTYTLTYEFTIKYRLNNLVYPFTNSLNENDYFLITGLSIQKGIPSTTIANIGYELKEIQIEDNYTIFSIRLVIPKTLVHNRYGGPEYMFVFFENDSSFYIKYDVYNLGYQDGFTVGYGDGYNLGLEDGYWNGHGDGYDEGYSDGYEEGENAGRVIGYDDGYDDGYNAGYSDGYDVGGNVGFEDGYIFGYDIGYNDGFNEGIKENWEFSRFLKSTFVGVGSFLAIQLLPGISIGAIIAVPILFGIIAFILGRRRG